MTARSLLLLPGDGIGPEIFNAMEPLLEWASERAGFRMETRPAGYSAFAVIGDTISQQDLELAETVDAVLFGAESTEEYLPMAKADRPMSCLLRLRKVLGGYANLRPIKISGPLASQSPLKEEVLNGVDFVIVRELLGGLYFGEPRRTEVVEGKRRAIDSLVYDEGEIARVAVAAFELARLRRGKLCSVDKANVLATGALWRDVVTELGQQYPDVELSHMYVDNCAMQLIRNPAQFDVIVTENMFGDILSDCAAMLGGSIGMLASASLGAANADGTARGLYEPISGTAPDIAGQGVANPIGAILSLALALRHSLGAPDDASAIERAVDEAIADGARTRDLGGELGTRGMVEAVLARLV